MACCLPTCAQGLSVPVTGDLGFGFGVFLSFFASSWCFVHMGLPALLASLKCTKHRFFYCRQKFCKTSFSLFLVFLLSRNSLERFWSVVLWHLWIGRARHPGPPPPDQSVGLEVFNVGGCLKCGDSALEARVDFLTVVEHRLIPARVGSELDRHRRKGLASVGVLPVKIPPMLVPLGLVSLTRRGPCCFAFFCYFSVQIVL